MDSGTVMPFIQLDGNPGLWSKGFICPQGLVCKVRQVNSVCCCAIHPSDQKFHTGNAKRVWQYRQF